MKFLKNHPFAVEAYFESSMVLTFAVPKEELQPLIPACFELDTFQNRWAFVAVAMVQAKDLRPKGFPRFLGNDFFLIGYRIFVRYTNASGKRLRGLFIIKSETNKKKMEFLGNIFTHYQYTTTDIGVQIEKDKQLIRSEKSDFAVELAPLFTDTPLPTNTPFANWQEARKFAGPLPFTFTYNQTDQTVLIVEGVRKNWIPVPMHIKSYHFGFINQLNFSNVELANAFVIRNIPYYWKKGKIEQWKPKENPSKEY